MKKADLKIPKITRLPSGSYTAQVMVDGKRHRITADTEERCAAELAAIKYRAMQKVKREKAGVLLLRDALENYLMARQDSLSPSTLLGYTRYMNTAFQSMMDFDINNTTDEQWQAAIRRESKGKSAKYVANIWGFFSSAIYEATGKKPRVQLPQKKKNTRPYLDSDEVGIFVAAIKGKKIEIAALLALSSLRRSEIKALRWSDVDEKNSRIHVQGAMVYGEEGLVHKDQNKTETSNRWIPIIPPLQEAFAAADKTGEYIVPQSGNWIYDNINKICVENGLPEVGIHGLRHSFAILAYHLQIPTKITMELGGWKDEATVNKIYTHVSQKDIAKRAADFSQFFKKNE